MACLKGKGGEGGRGREVQREVKIHYIYRLPAWLAIHPELQVISSLPLPSFLLLLPPLGTPPVYPQKSKMITNPLPEKIDGVGLQLDETPDRHEHVHADNPNPFPMPDSLTSCFLAFTPHSMPFSKNTVTWIESREIKSMGVISESPYT